MQHKTLQFKMDAYNEEEGIFTGYGSIFSNIDNGGDVVEPGAFTKTLAEGWERVKILALHNDCWLPLGKPLELREDTNGLYISAKISDTSMGKDVKVLLKDGVLNELSIGYDPVLFDIDEQGIRHLREVKLWEVSIVTWAMNPAASITGYKSMTAGGNRVEDIAEMVKGMQGTVISDTQAKELKSVGKVLIETAQAINAALAKPPETRKNRQYTCHSIKTKGSINNIEVTY